MYKPGNGGWVFSGNSGIQRNGSPWNAPNAPEGNQTAFIQNGSTDAQGRISQNFSVPTAGDYKISFRAALRSYRTSSEPMMFNVLVNNTVVGSFKPQSLNFEPFTTNSFKLSANTTHNLAFQGTAPQADTSDFIDNVILTLVAANTPPAPAPVPAPVPTPAPTPGISLNFGSRCSAAQTCSFSGAAENKPVTAACAAGVMTVKSATYSVGSNSRSCLSYVANACNGKSSCDLNFNNSTCGGDPALGYGKSGSMVATCSSAPAPSPIVMGCSPAGTFNPANPLAAGYKLSFSDDFNSPSSIDAGATGKEGYKWYTLPFFGGSPTPPSEFAVTGGALTITPQSADTGNWQLATAAPSSNSQKFVGSVFGNGGYFEAAIKFDPNAIPNLASNPAHKDLSRGWPSFWSLAIEHATHNWTNLDQWPGQASGFQHYIELDFFEFDTNWAWQKTYGGAIHDWYGVYKQTCPGAVCQITNTAHGTPYNNMVVDPDPRTLTAGKVDWNQWHRYGLLWVKGDATNGNKGYVQFYFDGYPTNDYVSWQTPPKGFGPGGVSPAQLPNSPYAFSILDQQRLMVILGSGAKQPMSIDYVRVWQLENCR